ncbi:GNAT family N-acetyltransferase [Paenibacillus wulumuqiensis]|uniref:GNAT family N-acetyltransferase n=1 Tax=Paenibacillus wulumuqiensis TaxID=1567107 RepID=UPI000619B7BF|nr:GNAT family protein [Paenibacillus wulumuqiensis]
MSSEQSSKSNHWSSSSSAPVSQAELEFYHPRHLEALMQFELPEEQHRFTALPAEVLEQALRDPDRYPVVITAAGEAVGFFILHIGSGIASYRAYTKTDLPELMLIRALLVDYSRQGQGYAAQAMSLLPGWVHQHFPAIRELILAVNVKNEPAQRLYLGTGFVDRGMRRQGIVGMQWIMHYCLSSK